MQDFARSIARNSALTAAGMVMRPFSFTTQSLHTRNTASQPSEADLALPLD